MKKIVSICLLALAASAMTVSAEKSVSKPIVGMNKSVTTYNVRVGYEGLSGNLTLSGATESPGFTATNTETGEVFDIWLSRSDAGTFLPYKLPGTINALPEGTYLFGGERGKGHWTGYGNVTVTLSPDLVDDEGYITVYVPIAWVE